LWFSSRRDVDRFCFSFPPFFFSCLLSFTLLSLSLSILVLLMIHAPFVSPLACPPLFLREARRETRASRLRSFSPALAFLLTLLFLLICPTLYNSFPLQHSVILGVPGPEGRSARRQEKELERSGRRNSRSSRLLSSTSNHNNPISLSSPSFLDQLTSFTSSTMSPPHHKSILIVLTSCDKLLSSSLPSFLLPSLSLSSPFFPPPSFLQLTLVPFLLFSLSWRSDRLVPPRTRPLLLRLQRFVQPHSRFSRRRQGASRRRICQSVC